MEDPNNQRMPFLNRNIIQNHVLVNNVQIMTIKLLLDIESEESKAPSFKLVFLD